jgi:hypothetical protein
MLGAKKHLFFETTKIFQKNGKKHIEQLRIEIKD